MRCVWCRALFVLILSLILLAAAFLAGRYVGWKEYIEWEETPINQVA